MGWFWNSSPKAEGSSQATPSTSTPSAPATPPAEPPSEHTDREVAEFLRLLQQASKPSSEQPSQTTTTTSSSSSSSSPPPPPPAKPTSSSWFSWAHPYNSPPPKAESPEPQQSRKPTRSAHSLAMSEHLLPTTMSCRDAFDYAWHCHTPGSQVTSVYRYGSVRTCSELWDDFWFCMRTKSYEPAMREAAIKEHYRAKEEAKYGGGKPSSEDVWESREERVPPGTAFQAKFDPPIVDDAEFQRRDAERRRRIREAGGD
ncbi:Early meiotic induction protein 1 [Madurella mycetomatis]|uniref:Early meiotic induction protein 1 n=1 Tax=Madurella mycetomatis TaxID=100816 RepID=A0A175WFF8_9PEZI|nr:Early meiotic induction protein 1 [Madurella mycetomatis]